MPGDDLTQQLAKVEAERDGARSDHEFAWARLNEQTRKLEKLTSDVLNLAQQWDRKANRVVGIEALTLDTCAAELRALTRQEDK